MVAFQYNGVTAELSRWTPRSRMVWRVIYRKASSKVGEWASEYGVERGDIELSLSDYAALCVRVSFKGKHALPLVSAADTPEVIQARYESYLDTEQGALFERILTALYELDTPHDEALTPHAESLDPEA